MSTKVKVYSTIPVRHTGVSNRKYTLISNDK